MEPTVHNGRSVDWMDRYQSGAMGFSVDHVAHLLKMDVANFARQAGIPEDRLRDEPMSDSTGLSGDSVLLAAYFVSGDLDKAVEWYRHSPVFHSHPNTAEMYVAAGRADAVLAYLHSAGAGFTG